MRVLGIPRRVAVLGLAVALAMVVGLTYYLLDTQRDARDTLRRDLGNRAAVAARLTSGALTNAQQAQTAAAYFAGSDQTIQAATKAYQGLDPSPRLVVFDAKGRILGAVPRSLRTDRDFLANHPYIQRALRGRHAFSDVFAGPKGEPLLDVVVPFKTKYGQRVLATAITTDAIQAFAEGFLASAAGVKGARAYLLDAKGVVLASSAKDRIGTALGDRALAAAVGNGSSGTYDTRTFVTAPVDATSWRTVFTVPTDALYAPVDGSARWAAWMILGAFVIALLGLLGLGAGAIRQSARLAHERLHDALTGLPNRPLFLDRANRALDGLPRSGMPMAVLFVDLDRFKHVNDSVGHEAGDELLVQVAQRLREAVRIEDTVSRFGGDEFLVLCERLHGDEEAESIAARIQQRVAASFVVAGQELTIGCSIGIAVLAPDDLPCDASTLIHDADLAMYRAKQNGRGRRERATVGAGVRTVGVLGNEPTTAT